jgi:SPP1 family holin|nr:MAG TPA: holin [Caudoviricetes sp.]
MNKLKNFLEQINVKDIKASTYVSAVVLIFTMVNYVLNIMGKPVININENEIAAWVTAIVGVAGIIYSWYKNQSITKPAQVADDVMQILKDGKITLAELEDFVAKYSEQDTDDEEDEEYDDSEDYVYDEIEDDDLDGENY